MTHDAAKRGVTTGTAVNYTLVARNNGPDTAMALQLRDDLPPGMSVEGASVGYNILPGGSTGAQVLFDLGSLAAGGTATVVLTMRVQASAGSTITNTASVAARRKSVGRRRFSERNV